MKFRLNNKYIKWGLTAFLVIAGGLCFYYLLFHGTNIKNGIQSIIHILMPIVMGLVMAYLMTPILNLLEYKVLFPICNKLKLKESKKRTKAVRIIGILLTVFLVVFLIYALIAMMLSQIVPSIVNIVTHFDQYINNFVKWLNKLLSDYPDIESNVVKIVDKYSGELDAWLNNTLLPKSSALIKTVSLSVLGVLKIIWNSIIGLIISVYVLASKEKFAGQAKKAVYAIFDTNYANVLINNCRFTHNTFIGFISGKVLDSIIIGLLCFIGTTLMNTPYAALVSTIVGVTNVIPFFGPYLGAIPSALLIFLTNPTKPLDCLYFIIFILVLQQFDGNFLGPKILGNSTGLTGFWVIFSITLFGGLFGVLGMIVGVPIFAVVYAAIKSFLNTALKKKDIEQNSDFYIDVAAITPGGVYKYIPDYKLSKNEKKNDLFGKEFISHSEEEVFDADALKNYTVKSQGTETDKEKGNKEEEATTSVEKQ